MKFEKICVVGLGYIGLPTAAVFCDNGVEVLGLDVNQEVVDTINRGDIHIVEPGLADMVQKAVANGVLTAATKPQTADAFLLAVPTPFDADMQPDLSYIRSACEMIAPALASGSLVILESTSPVGATEQMEEWLIAARPDLSFPKAAGEDADVMVAHCPERVLPGKVLKELVTNDRIIGGLSKASSKRATALYKTFVTGECLETSARTAEMSKLTENAFRDVNIAFANELSLICDRLDIDVWELIELANRHPRVQVLTPGPGVGGHCIAVDPWFIVARTPELAPLIRTARNVNDGKPKWVLQRIAEMAKSFETQHSRQPRIALYGIAFKPDIDDLRESPALNICVELSKTQAENMVIVEPNIHDQPLQLKSVDLVDMSVAANTCDLHVVLVGHSAFNELHSYLRDGAAVLDCCGLMARKG